MLSEQDLLQVTNEVLQSPGNLVTSTPNKASIINASTYQPASRRQLFISNSGSQEKRDECINHQSLTSSTAFQDIPSFFEEVI